METIQWFLIASAFIYITISLSIVLKTLEEVRKAIEWLINLNQYPKGK